MIECPVCKTNNSNLAVTCVQCHSFLQTRVQTLNFFETLWLMTESPKVAMKRIILSEQKNYIHLLTGVFGIGLFCSWLWVVRGGWMFENLQWAILALIIVGPIAGIFIMYLSTFIILILSKLLKGRGTYRNVKVILAYSLFPLSLASVFLVPLELGLFGMYLFTSNPPIELIKPLGAYLLMGLNAMAIVWSFILFMKGSRILYEWSTIRSMLLTLMAFGFLSCIFIIKI